MRRLSGTDSRFLPLYTFGHRVDFGVHVDPDLIDDPWAIALAIPNALDEMMSAGLGQPSQIEDPVGLTADVAAKGPAERVPGVRA